MIDASMKQVIVIASQAMERYDLASEIEQLRQENQKLKDEIEQLKNKQKNKKTNTDSNRKP